MKRIGFIDGRRVAGFTLRGTAALDGQRLDISDVIEVSSGSTRGVHINYTQSGAKTGSASAQAFAISLALKAAAVYSNAQSIYLSSSGNPVLDFVAPISMYIDNLGSNILGFAGLDIGLALTDSPAGRHAFIRMRNHVATIVKDGITIEGSSPLTNLFRFFSDTPPIVNAGVSEPQNRKIRIHIDSIGDQFIPLYDS